MKLKVRRKSKIRKITSDRIKRVLSLFDTHVRTYYTDYTNACCIKCQRPYPTMVRIFCLFFCIDCFLQEFDEDAKDLDRLTYKKWKKKFNKQHRRI